MRRTITAATAALLLATLTACGSSSDGSDKPVPDPKPSTTATSSPTAKAYTYDDCLELLEYDYQQGEPQDASGDPECSHLTDEQYAKAVAEILTAHKDEIIGQDG